jgi:hypothetical protein
VHRFPANPKPSNFDTKTKDAAKKVAGEIRKKLNPTFDESIWKLFAQDLSRIQHGKCGFCESQIINVIDPDVEHYRPKSEVGELSDDPSHWGVEIPHLPRLKGRKKKIVSKSGYWWLAYEWDNYLLACGVCNRKWKLTLFPVADAPRTVPPRKNVAETPLLLNPFFGPHPADHLEFDNLGAIKAHNNSHYGRESIKTCGLHRLGLISARAEKASHAHELLDELLADPAPAPTRGTEILREIGRMGNEKHIHCGMVRAILQQRANLAWQELENRLAAN